MAHAAAEFRNEHCMIQTEQLPTRQHYHHHHLQQQQRHHHHHYRLIVIISSTAAAAGSKLSLSLVMTFVSHCGPRFQNSELKRS
jgi:hypothetical protein